MGQGPTLEKESKPNHQHDPTARSINQQQNQNQSFIEAPKVEKILEQKHSFPEQPAQDLKPNVHGVGIIFTPDSAEIKLEPLGEITNAVKVFDERLQTTCDDFHTMSYSKQNYNQFLVANEGHRTYQIKKVESIIEGGEQCGIDVELREVTQLPDRISPINIQNPKISFLTYDPGGATCLFDKQEKLLGYASSPVQIWKKVDSIEQPTTDIWNSVGSTVKSELQQVFGTAGMNIYRVQTILAKEKINEVVRNDTINGQEKRIAIRVLVESITIQIPTFFAGSQSYGAIWTVLSLWKSGKSYEIFWLKATKMQIDILANGWDAENEILMPLDARNLNDFSILLETCRLLRNCD
ncbi:hypothetical protein V6N11_072064 [Hibiscus sabdariffa]|uniref:Uncharacterized protein n=1 Tax=Hibiscus sabdariffa TaxID=183260 RepID=A0ABR2U2J6_9ROSI